MSVGFVVLFLMTAATASGGPQSAGIQRVAWLQGCWELVTPERTVEEQCSGLAISAAHPTPCLHGLKEVKRADSGG
jgi:hypothetical protein